MGDGGREKQRQGGARQQSGHFFPHWFRGESAGVPIVIAGPGRSTLH
jgi:hypothetical protein